jgi:hypothetical protein
MAQNPPTTGTTDLTGLPVGVPLLTPNGVDLTGADLNAAVYALAAAVFGKDADGNVRISLPAGFTGASVAAEVALKANA